MILFGNYYILGRDGFYTWEETAIMCAIYPLAVWAVSHWSYLVLERNYKAPILLMQGKLWRVRERLR